MEHYVTLYQVMKRKNIILLVLIFFNYFSNIKETYPPRNFLLLRFLSEEKLNIVLSYTFVISLHFYCELYKFNTPINYKFNLIFKITIYIYTDSYYEEIIIMVVSIR